MESIEEKAKRLEGLVGEDRVSDELSAELIAEGKAKCKEFLEWKGSSQEMQDSIHANAGLLQELTKMAAAKYSTLNLLSLEERVLLFGVFVEVGYWFRIQAEKESSGR